MSCFMFGVLIKKKHLDYPQCSTVQRMKQNRNKQTSGTVKSQRINMFYKSWKEEGNSIFLRHELTNRCDS